MRHFLMTVIDGYASFEARAAPSVAHGLALADAQPPGFILLGQGDLAMSRAAVVSAVRARPALDASVVLALAVLYDTSLWPGLGEVSTLYDVVQIGQNLYLLPCVLSVRLLRKFLSEAAHYATLHQFSPILGTGVLQYDPKEQVIMVNGQPYPQIQGLTHRLYVYLLQNTGRVCSREEIEAAIYPKKNFIGGINLERVDKQVQRLRGWIEPNPPQWRYILTRNGGFILVDPDDTLLLPPPDAKS